MRRNSRKPSRRPYSSRRKSNSKTRRSRVRTPRRRLQRRRNRVTVARVNATTIPDASLTVCKYFKLFYLFSTGVSAEVISIKGHTPINFNLESNTAIGVENMWRNYYSFECYACKVTATFYNNDTLQNMIAYISATNGIAPPSGLTTDDFFSLPYVRSAVLGPISSGTGVKTISMFMSMKKVFGNSSRSFKDSAVQMNSTFFNGVPTSSPEFDWYFSVGFQYPKANAEVAPPNVTYRIKWYVKFFDRKFIYT